MLHGKPQCAASRMALHLEQTYGLQLDPYRHRQLVAELEEYAGRVDDRVCKFYPCGCQSGPGPSDMPDYCPDHGTPGRTEGCEVIPLFEVKPRATDEPAPSDPASFSLESLGYSEDEAKAYQAFRDARLGHPEPQIVGIQVPGKETTDAP